MNMENEPIGVKIAKKKKKKKKKEKSSSRETVVEIREVTANEYFRSSVLARWWTAYCDAFHLEHVWMEAQGQRTSRNLGLTGDQMMPLVFNDEQGSVMRRVCFVALMNRSCVTNSGLQGEHDIGDMDIVCGYATVDENPDVNGVCHIRMLLVPPSFQRRGIGVTILRYIVDCERFKKRHIGLKYAKCNDYEHLYGQVGFHIIGTDDMWVYMAIRR